MSADVVFQHSVWYGLRFRVPSAAWIADFQHRRCPEMFSARDRLVRDIGYRMLSHSADALVLSSADALNDCTRFYPHAAGRCHALQFVPRMGALPPASSLRELLSRYGLPQKFLFLPNQLWLHKNHLAVIAALETLAGAGTCPTVVACGNPEDYRHPDHPQRVIAAAASPSLRNAFRFLGMIPRADLTGLMRLSAAVINPSFSEGWSTTVEESKALGVPMLLSDIPVHREQAGDRARYFDPRSPESIASAMRCEWPGLEAGPHPEREAAALASHGHARIAFADLFASIAARAVASSRARR
jgi:glycosyltransferase involved in cell wall biosynthesis